MYPKEGIKQACSYLRDHGYLIVEVPDYSNVNSVTLPIPNQFNQEHINYFSETSFANLLKGIGCRVVCVKSVESKDETLQNTEVTNIFLLQKCTQECNEDLCYIKDRNTRIAIEQYLMRQEGRSQKIREMIKTFYSKKVPIVIWGTGALTMSLLASTNLASCNIVAFTDGNPLKLGTYINGMKIVSPESIKSYPDATILICAMKYEQVIKNKIAEIGLSNCVITIC